MNDKSKQSAPLSDGKTGADASFSDQQPAGAAQKSCPGDPARTLSVQWSPAEVYCADTATMNGTAGGIAAEVTGNATIKVRERGVGTASAKGKSSFKLDWKASGVDFEPLPTGKWPDKLPLIGELEADGLSAKTAKALVLKRLPDKNPEAVSFECSSPKSANGEDDYGWTAAFKMGVKNGTIQVKQVLQIKKAWLGGKVTFDKKKDGIKQKWGYIKKSATDWKYWDTASSDWEDLPRAIDDYTQAKIIFKKDGKSFKSRDDGGTHTWPESFEEPTTYEEMKGKWKKNIIDTWGTQFKVAHKDCTGAGLCAWDVEIDVDWSATAGDKLVWAIWAADWERSNASDWYLSEDRLGVAGHECGHLLGAYDEYKGGAIHPSTKIIEDDTIMGQNLTKGEPRHLDGMRDELKKKIKSWIGKDWPLEVKKR
jgi:hypothetical protein